MSIKHTIILKCSYMDKKDHVLSKTFQITPEMDEVMQLRVFKAMIKCAEDTQRFIENGELNEDGSFKSKTNS